MTIHIREVLSEEDVKFFWKKRDTYTIEDLIPNMKYKVSEAEKKWYLSAAYKDEVLERMRQENNQLVVLFFLEEDRYIGFATYVVYNHEPPYALVEDFCIDKNNRNTGVGKKCYYLLEKHLKHDGAKECQLTAANENSLRFWKSVGFCFYKIVEQNELYIKKIKNASPNNKK